MASSGVFPFENPILNELVEALFDIKTRPLIGGGDGGSATNSLDPIPPPLPAAIAFSNKKRSRRITMKGILDSYYEKENEEDDPMWVPPTKKKRKSTKIRVSDKGSNKKKMKPMKDSIEPPPKCPMKAITSTKFKLVKLQHSETEGNGLDMVTFDDKQYGRKGKRKVEDIEYVEGSTSNTKKTELMSISQLEAMNYCFSPLEVGQTSLLPSPSAHELPSKQRCSF